MAIFQQQVQGALDASELSQAEKFVLSYCNKFRNKVTFDAVGNFCIYQGRTYMI